MKRITLKRLDVSNFKGCMRRTVEFGRVTNIYGANATGKTTIEDALTWVLFGKDSAGAANFAVRPLGADGKPVDGVDISVEAVLDVDGTETSLKKVQRQNWVKKRGSDTPTLQGNTNQYEIDGFPASDGEFKARIGGIISEGLFELLTDPRKFAAMPWKEQRSVLTRFLAGNADEELAAKEKYAPIRDELAKAPLEKCVEKAKKAMAELKDRQKELPTRVDEAGKAIQAVPDLADLELQRNALNEQLAGIRAQMTDAAAALEPVKRAQEGLVDARAAAAKRRQEIRDAHEAAKRDARIKYTAAHNAAEDLRAQSMRTERALEREREAQERIRQELEGLTARWKETRAMRMDESETVCDKCGQTLPEERVEEIRAGFERRRQDALKRIEEQGAEKRRELDGAKQEAERLEKEAAEAKAQWEQAVADEGKAYEAMNAIPDQASLEGDAELAKLEAAAAEKEEALAAVGTDNGRRAELEAREKSVLSQLDEVSRMFAQVEANDRAKERMEELRAELRKVSQQVADQERTVALLEEFTRDKMEYLSGEINKHFELVRFKLFETQYNGGVKNVCEMQLGGVTYSNLNSAGKTQAGLDVIRALQKLYDVSAPIFLDNRESVVNIPEVDAQIVNLYVSEWDKALRVEVEE